MFYLVIVVVVVDPLGVEPEEVDMVVVVVVL